MDETVVWKVVCDRDTGLDATEQILEGSGERRRYHSELGLLKPTLRNQKPLSI